MLCWCDCLDDDQLSTATRARQRQDSGRLIRIVDAVVIGVFPVWRFGPEQDSDPRDIGGSVAIPVEAIVADAVLTFWQNVDQEPADELGSGQGHGFVSTGAIDAVILDAEGDAVIVHTDQTTVRDRHPVRVTRQISQHGFGSGEGFFGVDDPVDFAQRKQESVEGRAIIKFGMIAKEMQLPCLMQLGQPFQNETAIQTGQDSDGEEEVLAAGDPF